MNIKGNIYQLNFMWNFSKWKRNYEKIFKRSCRVAEVFLKYHKTQTEKKKVISHEELGQMTVLKDNQDKVTQLIHRIKVILKVA